MSLKRKLDATKDFPQVHESRKLFVYGKDEVKNPKKRRMLEPPTYRKKQALGSSVNAFKKRIRDVSRRLARPDLVSADIRIEDERALAVYQQELAAAEAEKIRQKMIKKYHMVRFFERQKASRQLKKLRKLLSTTESPEEVESLKSQIHESEVDLNYAMYHPLSETYISLFAPNSTPEELKSYSNTKQSKPPIWSEVENAMVNGSLQQLRDRIPNTLNVPMKVIKPREKVRKMLEPEVLNIQSTPQNRRQRRSQRREIEKSSKTIENKNNTPNVNHIASDTNDESDGGFFEL